MRMLHYPAPNRWHILAVALLERAGEMDPPCCRVSRRMIHHARQARLVAEMKGWRLP